MPSSAAERTEVPVEGVRAPDGRVRREEILVVVRDPETRIFLEKTFFVGSLPCARVGSTEEARQCARDTCYSGVLVSIESVDSVELIECLHSEDPGLPIAALASSATPELVRDVMCSGAKDFLFGSFKSKQLIARLEKLLSETRSSAAPASGPMPTPRAAPPVSSNESGEEPPASTAIISSNDKTERVLEIARKVAPTDSTVLIQGESGTGKELLARYIHENSHRADRVFVDVNCGALPENLLESQLFGHEKGSFTGASQRQLGLFEVANGGTIFLDEIGEMGLDMQVKILRVLQAREFRRIGGSGVVKVDVRVIAATNRELKEEVENGRFRTDLYYRLNVINLELPPLRERREDIPPLVEYFCDQFASAKSLSDKSFSPEAVEAMKKFRWEGNIRELENAVERLILLSHGDRVERPDVEEHLEEQKGDVELDSEFAPTLTLDEMKKLHVSRVLKQNEGNKMKSARMLKINVKTLYNLIKSLEIEVP